MTFKAELNNKVEQTLSYLQDISEEYSPIALANSLGAEDMVLTDMICKKRFDIEIFTLDTGRLHQETYNLLADLRKKYSLLIKVYYPNATDIELFVENYGINAFYDNVDYRKSCCKIRKVEPLQRALRNKKAWITGLRREQSITRVELQKKQWDDHFQLHKFNPLLDWTELDIWTYIREHQVPYNLLHDNNYPSIGCEPCTRAVESGEEVRAGRWWWENPTSKECGLHTSTSKEKERA